MGASFAPTLTIDENGLLSPAQQPQPLELEPGDKKVLRIDSWVRQPGGFCIASQSGPLTGTKWTLDPKPTDYFGNKFEPGQAAGMGLMVTELENGETKTFWWTKDDITLVIG
jgi:hypothetical protein